MKIIRLISIMAAVWGGVLIGTAGAGRAAEAASLVVHFDAGQWRLAADDKAVIQHFLDTYVLDANTRILIMGYTDNSGDPEENTALSRRRALSVRREMVRSLKVDAAIVAVTGMGERSPVADNNSPGGQARNRRAEIYLVNARERQPKRQYGPQDPHWPEIRNLLRNADAFTRQGQLDQAIGVLRKALALGGDHYADWHAAYGIVGYYAHAPLAVTKAHLDSALQLDPYHVHAREYFHRLLAREQVALGKVTSDMGQGIDSPISVAAAAQAHEFLRLFGVTPLAHRTMAVPAVDVWECLDVTGQPVTYYFDNSVGYSWAGIFGEGATASGNDADPQPTAGPQPVPQTPERAGRPNTVWESTVFR